MTGDDKAAQDKAAQTAKDKRTMTDLRALINERLDAIRPDRYTIGGITDDGESETAFLTAVAADIEPLIPEAEAKKRLAQTLVNAEESKATRRANDFFKDYARSGQPPMFWMEDGAWPVSITSEHPDDKTKRITERVALRALSANDALAFAHEERRRAAKDFAARNESCEGAELAAERTKAAGKTLIWDYFPTVEPPETLTT